jgi:hypothetical protein
MGVILRMLMSFRFCVSLSVILLVTACSPAANASATPSRPAPQLAASSSGVCKAIVALPDPSAAERAFINLAHAALHRLAADPRLNRPSAALVLETMQKVEADFSQPPDVAVLTTDLADLRAAADAALQSLGVFVPPCVL